MHPVSGSAEDDRYTDASAADESALAGLDTDQVAAVTTPSTLVAVIAGAGSGKTRVLTSRIAHRVAIGTADPGHTLALTFTREAAGELRRRLRRTGVRERVEAGTFHSVCWHLLRQRWRDLDRQPVSIAEDRERLLTEVATDVPPATLATESAWASARGVDAAGYVDAARAAGRRTGPAPHRIADALAAYQELKRKRGVIDLDDLLALMVRELTSDQLFADSIRWRFRHVHVDEAQDLNPIQFRLLELIVGTNQDLYLVGDPAQAIFGFNGADPSLLSGIADRLEGVEVIRLPTNHRCTPQIVAAGSHVLRAADARGTARAARADGPGVRVVAADDEAHEASLVAAFVRSLDPADVRNGRVAVIARTHEQLSRLEGVLRTAGLPVHRVRRAASTPIGRLVRQAAALPSATRLRAWALDVLDQPSEDDADIDREARVTVATAVLDFLREQPAGDGVALRWWLSTAAELMPVEHGVELLTFHAAKGREWPTVIVAGVETGLVPHRSATTNSAKAEEARLLHVALTRAEDCLVITWSRRRGGYARQPSPLLADLDVEVPPVTPVPAELRSTEVRTAEQRSFDDLRAWRERAARAAGVLPAELCTDGDLAAIAAARPDTPEALASVTGFGMLTATRLFPAVNAVLTEP